tara:strand:+ start:252 stop:1493 length:1242 start_codon:yes stop_codon:yes gene_type:complete
MANTTLTADIVAKEALLQLENSLVMSKSVFRGYEEDFNDKVNGYEVGSTIRIKRPMDFTVRDGATMSVQDVTEGKFDLTVDKRKGIDFSFTSQELTLDIKELSERVLKPAMIQLGNQVDTDLQALYKDIPSWVGTPGQTINSFADLSKAPERLDEFAVPYDGRHACLSPADNWGMVGNLTGLDIRDTNKTAYQTGKLGNVAGIDIMSSQNVPTHTVGAYGGTPLTNGGSQAVTYAASKDTNTQTLLTDGWTNSVTGILKAGDVFTIATVFAVNPVSKATLPFLRQFTVVADANSGATTGPASLTISPAAIASGAHQTVSVDIADNKAITVLGTASTGYRQNMVYTKKAFALVSVPLVSPPGAVDVSRQSYKGTTVRVIPVYDGVNDVSKWRLDILYGVKTLDSRLATRVSGTA